MLKLSLSRCIAMQFVPRKSSTCFAALCVALLATGSLVVLAQSGRHVRKPAPSPVPEIKPTLSPSPTPDPNKASLTFLVGMDRFSDYSRVPLAVTSQVMNRCANRLDEPVTVKVQTDSREMNRTDAIKRAKAEKEAYVVWLKLLQNNVSGRASDSDDPYNVYIQWEVFQPISAKREASGRIFPAAYRNRGVIVQPRTQTVTDYYLIEAGRETGEAILEHFHIR